MNELHAEYVRAYHQALWDGDPRAAILFQEAVRGPTLANRLRDLFQQGSPSYTTPPLNEDR